MMIYKDKKILGYMDTTNPRTIGDRSFDISRRYAQDSAGLDQKLLTEADISKGIQQPTYEAIAAELDQLLGLEKKNQPWANFTMPPNFVMSAIFHIFLIPSMGAADDIKDLQKKLEERKFSNPKDKNEQLALLSLLKKSIELSTALEYIQGKRGQFGKG